MRFLHNFINKAADLNWTVALTRDNLELERWSPAGEDMVIDIPLEKDSKDDCQETILDYLCDTAEDFDPDCHACEWFGLGRGEPNSLRALLDDAEEQKRMYEELYDAAWRIGTEK